MTSSGWTQIRGKTPCNSISSTVTQELIRYPNNPLFIRTERGVQLTEGGGGREKDRTKGGRNDPEVIEDDESVREETQETILYDGEADGDLSGESEGDDVEEMIIVESDRREFLGKFQEGVVDDVDEESLRISQGKDIIPKDKADSNVQNEDILEYTENVQKDVGAVHDNSQAKITVEISQKIHDEGGHVTGAIPSQYETENTTSDNTLDVIAQRDEPVQKESGEGGDLPNGGGEGGDFVQGGEGGLTTDDEGENDFSQLQHKTQTSEDVEVDILGGDGKSPSSHGESRFLQCSRGKIYLCLHFAAVKISFMRQSRMYIAAAIKIYKKMFLCSEARTITRTVVAQLQQNMNILHWSCIKVGQIFRCGYAATASIHAALPHENASLRLCHKTKTEKRCTSIQLTKSHAKAVAARPQRKIELYQNVSFFCLS
jgi:hypothetical protein